MNNIRDILQAIFIDGTPEQKSYFLRVMFRIIVSVHIAWACGFLAPLGADGFVFADEVDDKVQAAVEPIRAELGQISKKLETSEEIQKRLLVGQISAQLRDLNRLRCSTTDEHMRLRMERDIEDSEQEFKALTGERYPLPACKDL